MSGGQPPVAPDLSQLKVYPNPFRPNDGKSNTGTWDSGIIFSGLTDNTTIRIFTISGELVMEKEISGTLSWKWSAKNSAGERIARGVYIYLVTNKAGEKKIGKIAVIK